jgi:hypothetical protein
VTRGESNYIQSCGTVIENKINTYNNGRWTMGYRIQDLRIGESRQMPLSPRMQNPPQRSENGLFWCFGRGVFFVKALVEKQQEGSKKERQGGGRSVVIR